MIMKASRTWPLATVVTVLALLVAACGSSAPKTSTSKSTARGAAGPTIRIGLVTGLTGPYASLGQAQENGARLAIKQLGGRAGKYLLKLYVRDDQLNPALTLQQSKSLVQSEHVDFLTGCVSAATTTVMNEVATRANIPYLSTCQGSSLDQKANFSPLSTYHLAPLEAQDVNASTPWVCSHLGTRVYLLEPDYAFGHDQTAAYEKALPADGCNLVGFSYAPLGTTDFSGYIPKIEAAHPQVLIVGQAGTDQVDFMKQAAQFGLAKVMKIFLYIEDITFDEEMGFATIAGTYGATNFWWGVPDPGVQKFVSAYEAAYSSPPSGYAAYTYDAVMLIAAAAKAGDVNPAAFEKFMAGRRFDLAQGPEYIRSCDHQAFMPTYIVVGLSAQQAASQGGSATYGYRRVVKTVAPAASQAPSCASLGLG